MPPFSHQRKAPDQPIAMKVSAESIQKPSPPRSRAHLEAESPQLPWIPLPVLGDLYMQI